MVANVFGESRKVQLFAVYGFHVACRSIDGGNETTCLISEHSVIEGIENFHAFQKEWDTKRTPTDSE